MANMALNKQPMKKSPIPEEIPEAIGPYSIIRSIGRGGMGEVFLAQDPVANRQIALKRIKPELNQNKIIENRFLREAKVACVLNHPSIVPILAIENEPPHIYYTMPFVEGETLKQILARGDKKGSFTIPSLLRIFLQICEAIGYTHSKGILHRDLKPENIIVGKFGEVMILDWGIADFVDQIDLEDPLIDDNTDLTRPGKITGTLAYMAPERLFGKSSSVQTDIYALGVILYQMLTLQLPFQRKNLATFRKNYAREIFIEPNEMAPYRDIPHHLAQSCRKCLAPKEQERYQKVQELTQEIKSFLEGRSEWAFVKELDRKQKNDWLFQENILLAKNIAICRSFDVTEWAELMISKESFADQIRMEVKVKLNENCQGLGFLLNVPEDKQHLEEGYCFWIGPNVCKLFRNNVQVAENKNFKTDSWNFICIEKVEEHLKVYINGQLKLQFGSHLPIAGTHVGVIHKDGAFEMDKIKISAGSNNVMVNCLSVPNAFLSHKLYDVALQEYRRIAQCFRGRQEGREALFKAGITLLEKGKKEGNDKNFHHALKEFEKLFRTPGAPLEYLGKSMVYAAMNEMEEEAKCLELALRKFPNHPLLPILKEHIVYRMHESSLNNRESAYRIILLAIRHIPDLLENPDTSHLIDSLEKNLEPLPFFEKNSDRINTLATQLAFWLAKIPILVEIGRSATNDKVLLNNVLLCLQELEADESLEKFLPKKPQRKKGTDIWSLLLQKKWALAKAIFDKEGKALFQENSPLHFPYGTFLYMTQGPNAAKKHFASVLESPYPPTTALPSLFLMNRLKDWMPKAFWWEKKELHRQIELFYRCVGKKK